MKRRTIPLLLIGLGITMLGGLAWAYWSAGGAGTATAAATTLVAPGTPSLSSTNGTVTVSWTAATAPGAGTVSYFVERRVHPGSSLVDACGTSSTARITSLSCVETPGAGTYVWQVTAYFSSWTAASVESAPLVVPDADTTPPTGEVTAPTAGGMLRASVAIMSNSADSGSGVASTQFQRSPNGAGTWTNVGVADTTSPYSASWDTTTVLDGLYDLRVITTDNVGNSFTSPVVAGVRVDNTAPTGAVTAPSASSNVSGTVSVTSSSSDAGSGVASALFQSSPAGAGTWSSLGAADTVTPYATTWDTTTFTDGLYDLRVITTDNVGNTFTSATIANVRVDNTAPTGAVTAPAASANVRATVSVTANSADTGSGVLNAQFQTSPAGTNTWSNLGAADTTSPYSASWVTTTGFPDGLYDLRVITTDKAGNTFTSATTSNVRVDNTAPTVSVALASGPTGAYLNGTGVFFKANAAGNFQFVATVTDGGSGAASATFPALSATNWTTHNAETDTTPPGGPFTSSTFSWVATGAAPASYTITGTDASGNTVTSAFTFTVDSTAPTGSITAPAAAANVRGNAVSVTSSSADAGSGVNNAQFQISPAGAGTWSSLGAADTVTPYATTWDTTTFTDGLYDLRVITTDNVGNTFTSATIANVRVDNTAPTGAVTAPAANANVRATVSVTANSADTGSGVLNAQFQTSPAGTNTWSNLGAADTTSPYSASWVTTTGFPDGLYDLRVITTDKAGNTFTSALTSNVRVDNTAPTVAVVITSPSGAYQVAQKVYFKASAAGSFNFAATVTDGGSGSASALFPALSATNWTTHNAETVTTPSGGPYVSTTLSWTAGAAAPGTFTITAADASGNTVTSAFTFTVDSTAPTGSITAPAAAANVRGNAVSVTSSSADAGSGVNNAQFQISPAGAGTWSSLGAADTVTPYATTWDTTTFTDGLYDLRVITTDNVGNTFTSATIANVRVDNTVPTGAVTAPLANAFVNGASVAVSANSADTGSGVLNAQFQTSPAGTNTWSNLGAADATSPYGVTWNTTSGFPDGRYDVRVITTDKAGNTLTGATVTVEVQNSAPTATVLQLANGGGIAGRMEQGDTVTVTYSQTMRVSTFCSTWSGDLTDQSLTANSDVTVTVTDGGAGNDSLTVTSATCTFHFGTVNLGATGYVTSGNKTFAGSSTATKSTIAWSASTRTLTITLGQAAGTGTIGTVASSNATYTPDAAIKNGFGTVITGTLSTGVLTQF